MPRKRIGEAEGMKGIAVALLTVSLIGCTSLDRLLTGPTASRNSVGEPVSPSQPVERQEPYGVFSGYSKTGEKLYQVHWQGNELNGLGLLESIVDAMSMPKYKD